MIFKKGLCLSFYIFLLKLHENCSHSCYCCVCCVSGHVLSVLFNLSSGLSVFGLSQLHFAILSLFTYLLSFFVCMTVLLQLIFLVVSIIYLSPSVLCRSSRRTWCVLFCRTPYMFSESSVGPPLTSANPPPLSVSVFYKCNGVITLMF